VRSASLELVAGKLQTKKGHGVKPWPFFSSCGFNVERGKLQRLPTPQPLSTGDYGDHTQRINRRRKKTPAAKKIGQ